MHRRTFLTSSLLFLAACAAPRTPDAPRAETPTEPVILLDNLDFPEGPAFAPDGSLWCTEMGAGSLIRLEDGKPRRIPVDGRPNSLAFDAQGRAYFPDSANNQIRRYDPAADTFETLLDSIDGQPLLTPNDLCFDRAGNLLFTCPNYASEERTGYVACLTKDGGKRIADGFYRPNGLDLLGNSLVVADTYQKTLFRGAWNPGSAAWTDPQTWAQVGGAEGPDGMTSGTDGNLYCAIYGDGVIRVVNPDGKIAREIAVPGKNPTNAAFDPSGRLGLVVTEAEKGLLVSLPV